MLLYWRERRCHCRVIPLFGVEFSNHTYVIPAYDIKAQVHRFHWSIVRVHPFLRLVQYQILDLVMADKFTRDDSPIAGYYAYRFW